MLPQPSEGLEGTFSLQWPRQRRRSSEVCVGIFKLDAGFRLPPGSTVKFEVASSPERDGAKRSQTWVTRLWTVRDKWTKRETMSSAGFVESSLRDADTAGTQVGGNDRSLCSAQYYLIAMFLRPTHDRTRAAKNRRPFFFFFFPTQSREEGGGSAFDLALRPTFATPRCCLGASLRSYLLCLPLKR